MNRRAIIIACVLLALAGMAQAQNTTNLQLTVGPEAALTVTTGTTALATTGTNFTIPYTGTTNLRTRSEPRRPAAPAPSPPK